MAAIDFPSSPTVGQTFTAVGKTWQWNGSYWDLVNSTVAMPDIRARWTRSSMAHPGTNANIDFDAVVFTSAGAPTEAAGLFTAQTEGLYAIDYSVAWGTSSAPNIIAAWLNVTNMNGTLRYSSSQVVPTTVSGENGWMNNGSSTVRLRVGDTFSIQVFSPSGAPAGILSAEINVALVATALSLPTLNVAKGLVYHREPSDTSAPTTSTGDALVPGFPGPNCIMTAGRAYRISAAMTITAQNNYAKGWIRAVRSGSDTVSRPSFFTAPSTGGTGQINMEWLYTPSGVTGDVPVELSLRWGVFLGGGSSQVRNDMSSCYITVIDIGAWVAPS